MPGQGIRVLHADDEPGLAELAAEFIHRSNAEIQVTVVTSGPEALATLADGAFDCVVSDFDMPEMNGIELLEHVRESNPDLPFILFTGKGSEEVASEAISKGVSDYLQKESGTDQYRILANRIDNLVRQHRAESELEAKVEQQQVTAQLGEIALSKAGLDELFDQAVELVATTLDNEYAKVLEYSTEDNELFLCAGVGWQEGLVGEATVGDGDDSQAGHTLRSEEPIIVSDLDSDERFRGSELLTDHNVRSGISVVIGDPEDPWGVFGTHSTRPKTFTHDHVTFVQNVANILGSAIEQRAYRQRLERSQSRFNAILEHSESPMFMKDNKGVYLFVNQAYRDLFGLQDEEIIGRIDHDIHPAEMADEVTTNDQNVIETGETLETEERILANGNEQIYRSTKVPIYDTGDRADTDRPVAVFGLAQDVSKLKEQEAQLRNERNRFRAVFEKAFDAMVLADDNGDYTDVNASAVELFGLPEGELIGCSIRDFAPEDFDFDKAWETFQEAEAERGTFPVERPDGTQRMVEYAATANVTPGEHLSVLRDVTERERRDQQLEEQNEQLEAFASFVSHDLRNPLNVAEGRLELAKEDCNSSHLEHIEEALDRMKALIEDLLTLARQGERIIDPEHTDIRDLIENCWALVETENATLNISVDGKIPADESRLVQVFENLIRNAIEHGGDDVTITVGSLEDGIYVKDDGPGIPEEDRSVVFDEGYSTKKDGTGFGLSIVKEIVEAHGWEIRLTAGSEGGARFEITGVDIE